MDSRVLHHPLMPSGRKMSSGEMLVYVNQLEFFCAILLAVSEHRAQSLAILQDFIRDLKNAPSPR